MLKMSIVIKNILAVTLSLFLSFIVIAEEKIKLDTIDVYTSSPLPSIGLPLDMVPASIQLVDQKDIAEQSGVSVADFMVNNL